MHVPSYNSKIAEPPNILKNARQLWQRRSERNYSEPVVISTSFLFNLIRGKGSDPAGGYLNLSASSTQLSIPEERPGCLQRPGCISYGPKTSTSHYLQEHNMPAKRERLGHKGGWLPSDADYGLSLDGVFCCSLFYKWHAFLCLWAVIVQLVQSEKQLEQALSPALPWYSAQPLQQPLDVEARSAAQTAVAGTAGGLGKDIPLDSSSGPRFARFPYWFQARGYAGSPGRIRATEALGLDTSHFVTEDTLLNKINGLKSMFSYQAGWEWNHFSRTAHTASGPEGFSLHGFWTAEQKEKCCISAELSTAIAHLVLHNKAMNAA